MKTQPSRLGTVFKNKYVQYFLWLVFISFFYYVVLDFINIKGVSPDLFIILAVWIALMEGRLKGIIAGFIIGLFLDVISANVIGTNALTKTIAAFVASYFYSESTPINKSTNYKFILIVFLSALIHNLIYFLFFIQIDMQNFILFYLRFALASTAFTAFAATFVVLFKMSSNKMKLDL